MRPLSTGLVTVVRVLVHGRTDAAQIISIVTAAALSLLLDFPIALLADSIGVSLLDIKVAGAPKP